jgi:CubicO group peptidase (beta-lactamase class C family)
MQLVENGTLNLDEPISKYLISCLKLAYYGKK